MVGEKCIDVKGTKKLILYETMRAAKIKQVILTNSVVDINIHTFKAFAFNIEHSLQRRGIW